MHALAVMTDSDNCPLQVFTGKNQWSGLKSILKSRFQLLIVEMNCQNCTKPEPRINFSHYKVALISCEEDDH